MRRIRLQVRVEPLEAPSSPSAPSASRQEKILPWTEPCSEDLPISELWAKIESRFERIYPGRGPLRIKYLQDHYGSILDTAETVGDIFDDRTGGAELNATSIVRVVRFPPDRDELNNPQRFGSIMPESFARPQKRLLSNTQPTIQSSLREMAILEDHETSQFGDGYGRAVKRQRLQDATTSRRFDPDRPVRSRERDHGETPQRRISPVRQASPLHLTEDFQRPLAPRRPSPYAAPTSLSLIDRSNQVSFGTANQDGIPDSPPRNTNLQSYIDLDDDDTKSESPDLGRSLYDVPPSYTGTPTTGTEALNTETIDRAVPSAAGAEKLYTEAADHIVPKSVAVSAVLEMETAVPVSKETSQSTQPIQFRTPQAATVVKDFAERFSKSKQDLACTLPRNPFQSVPNPRKEPYDIWDPIKTDTDSSQNQQNWRNSACTTARSKESVQLPPLNHAKKPLTNGDVGPPSLGTEELQSSVTYIHDGEQPFHPLLDNLQRNGDNTNLQVSTTKIRTLMGPPKIASMDVLGKRQTSSLTSLSQSAKANEKPRDVRVCRERPTGDVFDGATRVISSITVGREIKPPEERRSQEPIRPAGWSKEEAQHEQFDRKGKAEEDKSPSNTERELENVASMLERLDSALQANQPRNGERQSKADENEGKGEEKAKQQKDEMAQEKSRNGSLEAKEAKVQKQSEQKKAKEFIVMEQKTNVLEKDAKRLKTDQTTKSNGRQDAAKEVHKRTVTTEASARKDNEVTKSRRAELATQNTRKSSEPGRLKSSTPLSSSVSRETKIKSLTSYPGSGGSRSSSLSIEHANPPQETPSRGAKGEEKTPLTSALRKSPNTLGRPVSSISWADLIALPDSTILAKPAATVPSSKADKRTGSSPINSAGVAASNTRQPSVEIIRSSPAASIDTGQRKSRDPPKKTSTNIKKQTKLNVKRDVKQKGRVIDPPSPPKPAVEEALVLSSDTEDSVSTYYSDADDDVQEIGSTKAGPSSKKKTKSDAKVATAKAVIIQMTPPDSQIRAAKKATVKRATPTIGSATNSQPAKAITTAKTMPGPQGITTHQVPDKHAIPTIECTTGTQQSVATDTQSNASSRSPARYVSSTPSSTSRSSAKSDASAVSSSPPDIASEPSSQASLEMKSTPVGSRMGSSNSIKPKDVRATPSANQRLSSQSSTQETQDTHTLGVESAVDQQLQREARQFSEPAQVQVQSSAPITKSKVTKSNPQTKAMPNATPPEYPYTMSGPRPANFRFPSLSKLKNNPPKYDPKEHLKHASFMSSQKRDDSKPISSSQTNGVTHDDGSSSESDDESASSSDDDNSKATRNPFSSPVGSQLSMKSDGRNAKGLSSLVKIAKRHGVNG